jgi:hypothetical protein
MIHPLERVAGKVVLHQPVAQLNDCPFDGHALMTKTKESQHPHAQWMTSTWSSACLHWFQRRVLVAAAATATYFYSTYFAATPAHRSPSTGISELISWHGQWCPSLAKLKGKKKQRGRDAKLRERRKSEERWRKTFHNRFVRSRQVKL